MVYLLRNYGTELLAGLKVTIQLCILIWSTGIVLGTILGSTSARYPRSLGVFLKGIYVLLAAVPMLVILFWMHYPMQAIFNVVINPFITAVVTLSIINTVFVAELFRNAIVEFPQQYLSAAKVCGLKSRTTFYKVYLPILLRQVLPGLLLVEITMLQATIFSSFISVDEIFRVIQRINSIEYRPIDLYTALALLFVIICVPLHVLSYYLKRRFTRNLSEV